jgi:REP element-mobilizing transposase RayT
MPQSLCQIYVHIVFSTKERARYLQNTDLRQRLHAYLAGTCKNLECPAITVGGVEDHVHILCRLGKTICISDLIRELKRESSKWMKDQSPDLASFYWQSGYGAFSISPAHVEAVREYIVNQEEHHKKISFQDEFRRLLAKYSVAYDEQYVGTRLVTQSAGTAPLVITATASYITTAGRLYNPFGAKMVWTTAGVHERLVGGRGRVPSLRRRRYGPQGRAAHPGSTTATPNGSTPNGLDKAAPRPVYNPFGVGVWVTPDDPGCAARPWAVVSNPFGVKRRPWVRCATLGCGIKPLRGKKTTQGALRDRGLWYQTPSG